MGKVNTLVCEMFWSVFLIVKRWFIGETETSQNNSKSESMSLSLSGHEAAELADSFSSDSPTPLPLFNVNAVEEGSVDDIF